MGCGCTAPSVTTGSSCPCTAPIPQAARVTLPVVRIGCCGNTEAVFAAPTPCGCSQLPQSSQRAGFHGCNCLTAPIPRYPSGVSQLNGEVGRNVWNF